MNTNVKILQKFRKFNPIIRYIKMILHHYPMVFNSGMQNWFKISQTL